MFHVHRITEATFFVSACMYALSCKWVCMYAYVCVHTQAWVCITLSLLAKLNYWYGIFLVNTLEYFNMKSENIVWLSLPIGKRLGKYWEGKYKCKIGTQRGQCKVYCNTRNMQSSVFFNSRQLSMKLHYYFKDEVQTTFYLITYQQELLC